MGVSRNGIYFRTPKWVCLEMGYTSNVFFAGKMIDEPLGLGCLGLQYIYIYQYIYSDKPKFHFQSISGHFPPPEAFFPGPAADLFSRLPAAIEMLQGRLGSDERLGNGALGMAGNLGKSTELREISEDHGKIVGNLHSFGGVFSIC